MDVAVRIKRKKKFQMKEIGEAVRDEAIEAFTDAVKVPFNL